MKCYNYNRRNTPRGVLCDGWPCGVSTSVAIVILHLFPQQFTLHASEHREDRVDVLLPPPPTSQTTPCSELREPNAVGVRVHPDAHRLLQRCACNLQDSALAPLQRVLHAAARFVAAIGPCDHITPTLIS